MIGIRRPSGSRAACCALMKVSTAKRRPPREVLAVQHIPQCASVEQSRLYLRSYDAKNSRKTFSEQVTSHI